jgi:cell division protease FtsH
MTDKFDMMALESVESRYLDGRPIQTCSAETATLIDGETLSIIRSSHKKAKEILTENHDLLIKIAGILVEKETIMGDEFMEIVKESSAWKEKTEV